LYTIENGDESRRLEHVQWADWDGTGRLLVATTTGRLTVTSGRRAGSP